MPLQIHHAADLKPEHYSWLFYGRSGTGKTAIIGTFPRPIFHVNFVAENGVLTLRGHSAVDYVNVTSVAEMNEALKMIATLYVNYKTIAIDSLTTWVDVLYRHTKKERAVTQTDWLDWRTRIYYMMEALAELPIEKVYTALLSSNNDEVGSGKHGGPSLFKSLEEGLPGRVDCSIYMEREINVAGETTFIAHPSGKDQMIGRMRGTPPMPPIPMPTYAKILAYLEKPLFASAPAAPVTSAVPPSVEAAQTPPKAG